MSHSTRVIAAFAMLLPIAVLSRAQAVSPKAAATHAGLQAVDADSLDDYIRASMHTPIFLAWRWALFNATTSPI
jgi:hypothetical protein